MAHDSTRNAVLWIVGLIPAVVAAAYMTILTVFTLLAALNTPLLAVLPILFCVVTIWGMTSVILVILEKPQRNAKYGLIAALVVSLSTVIGGLFESGGFLSELSTVVSTSLTAVSAYLLQNRSWQTVELKSTPHE